MLDLRQRAIGVACVALFVLAPAAEAAPPKALIGPAQAIGERTITLTGSASANGGTNARYFWNYGPLGTDPVLHTTMRPLGSSGPVDAVVPVAPLELQRILPHDIHAAHFQIVRNVHR